MRLLASCLALPVLLISNASAQEVERFSIGGERIALFNIAGDVIIERGTGSAVSVEVIRHGSDADRLSVRTGEVDGWRTLRVVYPELRIVYPRMGRMSRSEFNINGDGTFGNRILRATLSDDGFDFPGNFRLGMSNNRVRVSSSGSGLEAYADLRVQVPAGRTLAVQIGVGRVHIANVDGHLRVEAQSGPIDAARVNGSLLATTGSGGVTVSGARGHVRIDTGSGSVRADDISNGTLKIDTGSGGVDAANLAVDALDIDTGSGGIRVDDASAPGLRLNTGSGSIRANRMNARDLSLDTGSGSITLELLSDVRSARLDTGSGGVTLVVPPDLGAELVIDTGSGGIDIETAVEITQKRRSHLRGRIGDGQGNIIIDTGSGTVSLRPR